MGKNFVSTFRKVNSSLSMSESNEIARIILFKKKKKKKEILVSI